MKGKPGRPPGRVNETTYTQQIQKYFQNMDEKEFIETFFSVIDKKRIETPFKFNIVQDSIHKFAGKKNVILKYRKPGVSLYVQVLMVARCLMFRNQNCVMLSYDKEATTRMLDRTDWILRHLPFKVTFDTDNKNEFKIRETNSKLYVGVAGSKSFGRGDDVTILHISELAFWDDTSIITGLMESLTDEHQVFIESTANGPTNLFAQLCRKAQVPSENSDWKFHFFPWWIDPNLEADVPKDFAHTEEEKELIAAIPEVTPRKIMWRRKKIESMLEPELFPQEFPATIEEAFVTLGACIFNKRALAKYKQYAKDTEYVGHLIHVEGQRPRFEQLPKGNLKIWKFPEPGEKYMLIVDTSDPEGRTSKNSDEDPCCIQVVAMRTMEQCAVWHGQAESYELARITNTLGIFYNSGLVIVERTSTGPAVIDGMRAANYPNMYTMQISWESGEVKETEKMGFPMNVATRPLIVEALKDHISSGAYILHDPDTVAELSTFVRNKKTGKIEAASGSHDDRVIPLGIGAYVRSINPVYEAPADRSYVDRFGLSVPGQLILPGRGGY